MRKTCLLAIRKHCFHLQLWPEYQSGMLLRPGSNHLMIKVGFEPGGLYRFLGIPMNELLCKDAFDCTELLGSEVKGSERAVKVRSLLLQK